MRFVLDSSALVRAVAHDEEAGVDRERDVLVRAFLDTAVVPAHWHVEVVQAATSGVRSARWSLTWARGMMATARALGVTVIANRTAADELLELALASGLTAQDAAYLQLARDLDAPLATADAALRDAAERLGVVCV